LTIGVAFCAAWRRLDAPTGWAALAVKANDPAIKAAAASVIASLPMGILLLLVRARGMEEMRDTTPTIRRFSPPWTLGRQLVGYFSAGRFMRDCGYRLNALRYRPVIMDDLSGQWR
jgi:hypothetical protein